MADPHILTMQAAVGDDVLLRVDVSFQVFGSPDPLIASGLLTVAGDIASSLVACVPAILGSRKKSTSSDQASPQRKQTSSEEPTT